MNMASDICFRQLRLWPFKVYNTTYQRKISELLTDHHPLLQGKENKGCSQGGKYTTSAPWTLTHHPLRLQVSFSWSSSSHSCFAEKSRYDQPILSTASLIQRSHFAPCCTVQLPKKRRNHRLRDTPFGILPAFGAFLPESNYTNPQVSLHYCFSVTYKSLDPFTNFIREG